MKQTQHPRGPASFTPDTTLRRGASFSGTSSLNVSIRPSSAQHKKLTPNPQQRKYGRTPGSPLVLRNNFLKPKVSTTAQYYIQNNRIVEKKSPYTAPPYM